jgi:hypothetical protein
MPQFRNIYNPIGVLIRLREDRRALMKVEEYRRNAWACLKIAGEIADSNSKTALIQMADAWKRLADQAEKNNLADLVYEPPAPKAPPQ